MDWTAPIDGYCERLDATFWAEPVNALTNAAFLLAALVMAARIRGTHLPLAWALVWLLEATGIGSFLFHTFAQLWAGMADTLPTLAFILTGLFAATRDFLGTSSKVAALVTLGFFPFAAATVPLFRLIPGLGGSAGYAPVPLLMIIYAALVWRHARATARPAPDRRPAQRVDRRARARRAALRRLPARHAFPVAPAECGPARHDGRGLPAAHAACSTHRRDHTPLNTTGRTPFTHSGP